MVPEAYPPRPFVRSHCFCNSLRAFCPRKPRRSIFRMSFSIFLPPFAGREQNSRMARDVPILLVFHARSAATTISGTFARPLDVPGMAVGASYQRFRRNIQMQISSQIHEQQTVISTLAEKSYGECFLAQNRAV